MRTDLNLPPGFVAIHDPKKPGDYRVLSTKEFDPTLHTRYEVPLEAPKAPRADAQSLGTPAAPVGEVVAVQPPASAGSPSPAADGPSKPSKKKASKNNLDPYVPTIGGRKK